MNAVAGIWWRLVRFGFRLLYNELAFTYDVVSWVVSLGAWRCWQFSAIPYLDEPDKGPVLEIAHGTGHVQSKLHALGYGTVVGYDLSQAMGRITRARLLNDQARPLLARGYAQNLPFASETFSSVVTTFPTDFIVSTNTLQEIHRVLTPDGVLVIVPSAQIVGGGWMGRLLEWAYRITGQREGSSESAMNYFKPYFNVALQTSKCARSRVDILICHKAAVGEGFPEIPLVKPDGP